TRTGHASCSSSLSKAIGEHGYGTARRGDERLEIGYRGCERATLEAHGCVLARRELPLGRADLPDGEPAAQGAAAAGTREAAAARALGHDAGAEFRLRPSEPDHSGAGRRHDL